MRLTSSVRMLYRASPLGTVGTLAKCFLAEPKALQISTCSTKPFCHPGAKVAKCLPETRNLAQSVQPHKNLGMTAERGCPGLSQAIGATGARSQRRPLPRNARLYHRSRPRYSTKSRCKEVEHKWERWYARNQCTSADPSGGNRSTNPTRAGHIRPSAASYQPSRPGRRANARWPHPREPPALPPRPAPLVPVRPIQPASLVPARRHLRPPAPRRPPGQSFPRHRLPGKAPRPKPEIPPAAVHPSWS